MKVCCICMEHLRSSQSLNMDGCTHSLCWKCCVKWVAQHGSCPMCRSPSTTMSRPTRSSDKCTRLFIDLCIGFMKATSMKCQCAEHGPLCPSKEIVCLLERCFFNEKVAWRRPDMAKKREAIKYCCVNIKAWLQECKSSGKAYEVLDLVMSSN